MSIFISLPLQKPLSSAWKVFIVLILVYRWCLLIIVHVWCIKPAQICVYVFINHTTHEHTSFFKFFLIHHRGVHWVLVQYAQMDFVLQYLKLMQFLVMCHFYWTLATRALRRERLTNWWVSLSLSLWLVTILLSLLFFSHWQIIVFSSSLTLYCIQGYFRFM